MLNVLGVAFTGADECYSQSVIVGCYVIVFGLGWSSPGAAGSKASLTCLRAATALLEFQIPPYVSKYASFLFNFLGRGICKQTLLTHRSMGLIIYGLVYIFVGSILLHGHALRYIAGSIIAITGVAYVVLEYIPSIEPPQNMRDADVGWGAEQV